MRWFSVLLLIVFLFSCSANKEKEGDIMKKDMIDILQKTASEKIYFGHQSVGQNILQGLQMLIGKNGVKINILDFNKDDLPEGNFFIHSKIGKNREPYSKCDDFAKNLQSGLGEKIDIAFMKFCFVDIMADDDPEQIFDYYRKTLDSLKSEFPDVTFIHVTVPLTVLDPAWKVIIKKILKKKLGSYIANVKRHEYNEMLKKYYKNDLIFDLAKAEATYQNGELNTFSYGGKTYMSLIAEYSNDGAHLNELGQITVANELLKTINSIAR